MLSTSKGNPSKLFWGYITNVSDSTETEHIVSSGSNSVSLTEENTIWVHRRTQTTSITCFRFNDTNKNTAGLHTRPKNNTTQTYDWRIEQNNLAIPIHEED